MLKAKFRREETTPTQSSDAGVPCPTGRAKLERLEMLFDVLGFLQLLARTTSSSLAANLLSTRAEFPVVPNILGLVLKEGEWAGNIDGATISHKPGVPTPMCSGPSIQPRLITKAEPPFCITHVNAAWCTLCGFRADEAVGHTLSVVRFWC